MSDQKRRERGTGSITKISDTQYRARLCYISPVDGKSHEKRKLCKSEAEAAKVIKAWNKDILQQSTVDIKKESVQKFMTNWLVNFKKPDLKPTSYDRLEYTLEHYLFPRVGMLQMGAVNAEAVQKVLNDMHREGLTFSTIKKVYDAFNACFKWGVSKRSLSYNPMGAVTVPGASKHKAKSTSSKQPKVKYFTLKQQDALIDAATAKYPVGTPIYRYGYAIPLLLNTGLRLGELLALQWKRDVDLDQRTVNIDNSIVIIKNRDDNITHKNIMLEQDSVKSESGRRTLYLNDEALDALTHLNEVTGQFTYVLSSSTGNPIQPSILQREFSSIKKRAGIPSEKGLGIHALRHSFATNLLRAHVEPKIISKLLGHADIGVTMNIYAHVMQDQKQEALITIANRK